MTDATNRIELDRVSKWYGDVLGVNEITLGFGAGVTGLLGPNGAGKSTLLKAICGMLRPNIGTIRVDGRNPFRSAGVMANIGLCPEQDSFYGKAGAWDVVTYLTRLQGFGKTDARNRARHALERVGLAAAMTRSVAGYSKGMRQRFKLAQALAHDPTILILDEPMNGLDPGTRKEIADLIKSLGAEGRCVVVSSHVLHEVDAVAERIVVMRHGRVLADGTARSLREEMSEFPLTVSIKTTEPAVLAAKLASLAGVRRVERSDDGVEIRTTAPDDLFDTVALLAANGAVPVSAMTPTDEDLEAVFRYLTE